MKSPPKKQFNKFLTIYFLILILIKMFILSDKVSQNVCKLIQSIFPDNCACERNPK